MKNLAYLNRYLWKYRGRLFMGVLFIILANVFNVYAPVLVGQGVDFLADALTTLQQQSSGYVKYPSALTPFLSDDQAEISPTNTSVILRVGLLVGLAYVVVYVLKGIFLYYQRQTIIVMSRYIEYDLKNEIYDQYQRLDTSFYKRNRTGDLMNRISEDVSHVRMYLGPAVMYTINLAFMMIMCVFVMWRIDAELTLYTLSPLPFMMIMIFYVSTIINRRSERVQRHQSQLSTMVQESFSGIRILRAFSREASFAESFAQESEDYKQKQLRLVRADALFMPVMIILVGLSTVLTIYIGAGKVMSGEITYGVIVQFVFYVNLLTWPFAMVGWVTSLVQKAEASQQRINEFLQARPAVSNPVHDPRPIEGDIEFRNVTFVYPESGILALKEVSFHAPAGSTLAIVGRTGSGKSTIAHLLLRLFDPTEGAIAVDRKDLRQHDLFNLRDQLGFVPQDVFLFSDSIGNNIAFGSSNATQEQIERAAEIADLSETIMSFPQRYDTLLGERGINLSGGQKQRVSIARAIIRHPAVLIFDDCLSAVDTETEDRILSALRQETKGRTTIIIAHRLSSVKYADQILVMDHGHIAERGSHESLIAEDGLYAAMWRRQQLEQEDLMS